MSDTPVTVLVDCDPGIDDALALFALVQWEKEGRVRFEAVSTVSGNLPLRYTATNAAFVLDKSGAGDIPVYLGADRPLSRTHLQFAEKIHGPDGLGGVYEEGHVDPDETVHGAIELARRVRKSAERSSVWILALGPLTNLAIAFALDPGLPDLLEGVLVMGGAFGAPGGNTTPWAEFNFAVDPEAVRRVCVSGARIFLIPLDVTHQVPFTERDLQRIETRTKSGRFALGLFQAGLHLQQRRGAHEMYLHDALAASALILPDLFQFHECEMEIGLCGDLAGASLVRSRRPGEEIRTNVSVAFGVEVSRARSFLLQTWGGGGASGF